ncbi:MAG: hypothetical protein IJ141_07540 [Lachnospiraceae bacterium]|nr:hypothetical protein [Lachnospiraceae bacterium]
MANRSRGKALIYSQAGVEERVTVRKWLTEAGEKPRFIAKPKNENRRQGENLIIVC